MASLQRLEEEVESFVLGTQEALAEEATGRAPRADIAAVERAHPLPASADTLATVREAAASAQTPQAQRPRLLALVPFLAHTVVDARVRGEDDALRAARRAAVVSAVDVARPLEGVWRAVGAEAERPGRAALARAAADAEEALLGAVQRRWEAARRVGETLAVPPPAPAAALVTEAVEFLRNTEDAYRDVLGFALRRLEPGLRPWPAGEAGYHDLLRLAHQPLPGAFPSSEALHPLRRWLDASGLTLAAAGRLQVAEGPQEAACFALEVPQRILLVQPAADRGAFPQLVAAVGRARALAEVAPSASLRARRLGDEAVRASASWLFRSALASEAWLRRFLSHGKVTARELARLSALVQLGELRQRAALRPLAAGLAASGPTEAGLQALAAATSEALLLHVPCGALLPGLEEGLAEADGLRAAALAECLRYQAEQRFDAEDFRNPAAARWLAAVWARGAELDAEALAKEVGGAPLALAPVGHRLVAVLGA